MKNSFIKKSVCALGACCFSVGMAHADEWIRINQLGYLPQSVKVAVFMSDEATSVQEYALVDVFTKQTVKTFRAPQSTGEWENMKSTYRLDFSDFVQPGTYYLKAGNAVSPTFPIAADVYKGTADFLLNYLRQQRCGDNPRFDKKCHQKDAYIVYHPTKNGQHIDVRGGWHDASDYLQYTTTTANAIYQMMFAYQQNPEAFGDEYGTDGRKGANGIPDIIDEIRWGMDWLNRMNPEPGEFYNQLADDRDHVSMRLPFLDPVDYGYGPGNGRPVYFCSGEKQKRGKFMNETTGVASTTGKFASCFSLGSRILKDFYPELAEQIGKKAKDAFDMGVKKPGVCQTASIVSPYIYEEDNWTDDMELAAMELYHASGEKEYLNRAVEYARREPVTPWMGADSARHYQWYPFVNLGHYHLAKVKGNSRLNQEFVRNLRAGIERTFEKAVKSPFLHGIPYIWCSNNLTVAMLTQCGLYRELTGDRKYAEMEAAMLDWLLGCNPWGTSMIIELPLHGDYPSESHAALLLHKGYGQPTGGLVDGPVYNSIFKGLRGVNLNGLPGLPGEKYEAVQPRTMVYHDVVNDYSTNEPTMDGTASLTYYLSLMEVEGMKQGQLSKDLNRYVDGGIVGTNPGKKVISLVFTSDDKVDGEEKIIRVLDKNKIKGSFFFTGNFFRRYPEVVKRLLEKQHYVGSHSDKHLLYMPWENRDSLLVSRAEFENDLLNSYREMSKLGINYQDAPLFMPPYEYYNRTIAAWTKGLGLRVVNYTPGTLSNADYTTPDMGKSYRSSKEIYEHLLAMEKKEGLNGAILLVHFGTDPKRTDKFYDTYLNKLIQTLKRKGYQFQTISEAVAK